MYLEHFGLGVNPFSLSPKLDFLYKSGTFEESMAHLVFGLDNHEAIVLITGAIGTGKTMALQSFLTNLGPRFEFALITNTRVTAVELLKLVLEDLGVGLPIGADKSDLLILFKDYLHGAYLEGKMVLIVVDEAQNLAPEVLEEIRLLTNLGQGDIQPVQIILVGQPELEETVNRPDLAQIRQRIRVHYNLDPLTRSEAEEYLNHRMAVAGCKRHVFTSGAIDRIFKGSRGVPRLVNTMAGEALLAAFVAGHEMVQPGDIEEDQDLSFATGPAPAPKDSFQVPDIPQPVAAPAPPPPPPPPPATQEPAPVTSTPPEPVPAPEPVSKPASPAATQPIPKPKPAPALRSAPDPVPEPTPEPAHAPPVEPVAKPSPKPDPEPDSKPEPQGPPLMAPAQPPPIPPRRRSRGGMGKIFRPWFIGAIVVLALGALYQFGLLDGLVDALYTRSEQEVVPAQSVDNAVTAGQRAEDPGEVTEDDPSLPGDVQVEEQEDIQGGLEQKLPENNPSVPPSDEAAPEETVAEISIPQDEEPLEDLATGGHEGIFIHIYSFRTPERAESFVRRWTNPEDSISVISQEVRGVIWHRVYLGPYATRDAALLVALRLKQKETIDYYKLVQLSGD